jgi:recombination DNA repair RAD52 pathway protein
MSFSAEQLKELKAKLDPRHIRTRAVDGANLHYLEGWHVVAEANRIFGFDAWDRRTLATTCIWSGTKGNAHAAVYAARVRVRVRAGDLVIVREGSGTGEAKVGSIGQAHDLALKGAETDATKRALATFGNPFGLALYDPEQLGVRKVKGRGGSSLSKGSWIFRNHEGAEISKFEKPSEFGAALRKAMTGAEDIELLFGIWEQNVDTLREINLCLKQVALPRSGLAPQLVNHLKQCAIAFAKKETIEANGTADRRTVADQISE